MPIKPKTIRGYFEGHLNNESPEKPLFRSQWLSGWGDNAISLRCAWRAS